MMEAGRDIKDIFEDVIRFAIGKEQESIDLYSWLAAQCSNSAEKELLDRLTEIEKEHKKRLENLDRDLISANKAWQVKNLSLVDEEAVLLNPGTNKKDILLHAIEREEAAFQLYSDLAGNYASIPEIQKTFETLAQEEASHISILELHFPQEE